MNINDKHQYDDEEEKSIRDNIEFKKIKVYNIEDYIRILIEKLSLNQNQINDFENVLLLLQKSYYYYL